MSAVCHFCESPAHGPCHWPVERFVETEAKDLKEGDMIRPYSGSAVAARVVYWSTLDHDMIDIHLKGGRGDFIHKQVWNDFQRVRVMRTEPCGQMACQAHLAARGPGVYVCWDHIFAWESVA